MCIRDSGVVGVQNAPKVGDRLKPPPDAVNFERKRIRLISSSSDSEKLSRSKDSALSKVLINEHKRQSTESKSDCKPENNLSDTSKVKPEVKETKRIILKRNHLIVQVSNFLFVFPVFSF